MNKILLVLLCLLGPAVSAQTQYTVAQSLDHWINNAERDIVSAADAMPEERYAFKPQCSGEFADVRTFGQQVKHLASNNYRMAKRILGQNATPDEEAETGPDTVQTKAQIMEYVRGSFVALHRAVATVNPENMLTPQFKRMAPKQNNALQFATDAVAHSYDHYGQMVEYLRMNGIVPPSSRK